jgi:hypothetical protein
MTLDNTCHDTTRCKALPCQCFSDVLCNFGRLLACRGTWKGARTGTAMTATVMRCLVLATPFAPVVAAVHPPTWTFISPLSAVRLCKGKHVLTISRLILRLWNKGGSFVASASAPPLSPPR